MKKILLHIFVALLPYHALLITFIGCKLMIDTTIIRFWKDIFIIGFFLFVMIRLLIRNKGNLSKIYKNNTILGLVTAFGISTLVYIFFPYFAINTASILGFRYDMFFFLALIIGMYIEVDKDTFRSLLKTLFISTGTIILIFLPWYLSGNIALMSEVFGYSSRVSTYSAGECIAFAQNTAGHHRFQGSFAGPIRFSVFLTIVSVLFYGFIREYTTYTSRKKNIILLVVYSIVGLSVLLSFSKTSILGGLFAIAATFFTYKYINKNPKTKENKEISAKKKNYIIGGIITGVIVLVAGLFASEKFLHIGSVLNRLDNLKMSLEMFLYNPIGYGLGIAGPASQLGTTIESAGAWEIAVFDSYAVHKFLPENWYVQILLEQGIIGFSLFISLIITLGVVLYKEAKTTKSPMSISIFVAYLTLCFMANFTHAFEESATSYILFLIIGLHLSLSRTYKYQK